MKALEYKINKLFQFHKVRLKAWPEIKHAVHKAVSIP